MLVDCVLINHYHYLLLTILRALSMTKQNIVVVGAGYAGVSATKFLAKKFKKIRT